VDEKNEREKHKAQKTNKTKTSGVKIETGLSLVKHFVNTEISIFFLCLFIPAQTRLPPQTKHEVPSAHIDQWRRNSVP
jgi:hypothetical protein